jgi:hypothetical protein
VYVCSLHPIASRTKPLCTAGSDIGKQLHATESVVLAVDASN